MPRKGGFGCFGSRSNHPEIRYGVDSGGVHLLQEFAMPMPEEGELNSKFAELVVSRSDAFGPVTVTSLISLSSLLLRSSREGVISLPGNESPLFLHVLASAAIFLVQKAIFLTQHGDFYSELSASTARDLSCHPLHSSQGGVKEFTTVNYCSNLFFTYRFF